MFFNAVRSGSGLNSSKTDGKLGGPLRCRQRMLKIGIIFVFALAFSPSTASSGQAVKATESAPDTLIVLQRGACEQRCAVYRIVIFADGTVVYEGRHFVRKSGLMKTGVSQEVLSKLISDLEAGGFFQLEDNYGYGNKDHCDSIDSDGPAAILSVSNRGRSKTVLHNHRCVGSAPHRLTELEDEVDRAVGTAQWIK
jgi:hypothetical protein